MEERGLTVIDLFCGAGGFSEGFHQAGFDVVLGVDNWRPACETHRLNGLGVT
ncbi:MAG: DNA cytosine methyltransferase, partial [Thermoplasmata archaeon]